MSLACHSPQSFGEHSACISDGPTVRRAVKHTLTAIRQSELEALREILGMNKTAEKRWRWGSHCARHEAIKESGGIAPLVEWSDSWHGHCNFGEIRQWYPLNSKKGEGGDGLDDLKKRALYVLSSRLREKGMNWIEWYMGSRPSGPGAPRP